MFLDILGADFKPITPSLSEGCFFVMSFFFKERGVGKGGEEDGVLFWSFVVFFSLGGLWRVYSFFTAGLLVWLTITTSSSSSSSSSRNLILDIRILMLMVEVNLDLGGLLSW